jgi:hypothetical protein
MRPEHLGRAQKHRHVQVVTTSVHGSAEFRRVRQTCSLTEGKRIHVGPENTDPSGARRTRQPHRPGYHCTAEEEITSILRSGGAAAPVISSAGALISGLAALGARRVAILTPYLKPLTALVAAYLEDAGGEDASNAVDICTRVTPSSDVTPW